MATADNAIEAWLTAACATVSGVKVLQGGTLPETIPAAGLVNVVAPEEVVETAERLGGAREMMGEWSVEIAVQENDDAARASALDALAKNIAAAILAAALPAPAYHRRLHPLRDRQDVPTPGASAVRSATIPVEVHFETGLNPMEDV